MKKEIKKVVNNLANADLTFTTEDELEFCKKVLQAKEQECEKFENRADKLKNTLAKVNEKINRIIEIDGYGFNEALTKEIKSIQNLIRKAIFKTGENECQTKQ